MAFRCLGCRMEAHKKREFAIVASLFAAMLLIFGSGYDTAGVFFSPLLHHFGWSRARLSMLPAAIAVAAGLSVPFIGLILDRFEARVVMAAGAVLCGAAFMLASIADSFGVMILAYSMLGVGLSGSTLLPASIVIVNWFGARRGLAMALTMAGTTVGGMVMTLVASHAIAASGYQLAYRILAAPMFIVVVPLVLLFVRTRPPGAIEVSTAEAAANLPGLEVGPALRSRSFWMITIAQFLYAFAAAGSLVHVITFLIGIGYGAAAAAFAISMVFGANVVGKIVLGLMADRSSGRVVLAIDFAIAAFGTLFLFGADRVSMLAVFVVVYGLAVGAPLALIPMVIGESLGLKRFGTLGGFAGVGNTLGAALGPIIAGRIFDVTHSYDGAFALFAVILAMGAAATLACRPLSAEEAIARPVPAGRPSPAPA